MVAVGMSAPQTNLKLGFFHMEIARLIGEGLPNREIKKHITISDSRLSVLRANPLIRRAAERYRQMNEDKYRKALETFADGAQKTAEAVVDMMQNALVSPQTKLAAATMILEHASYLSPEGKTQAGSGGTEVVFEQMLRVTKRGAGQYTDDAQVQYDPQAIQAELGADCIDAELVSDADIEEPPPSGPLSSLIV